MGHGLNVEVAFARPDAQILCHVHLPAGGTAAEAVEASGVLELHPGIDWPGAALGVFGRRVSPDQPLRDGDRVEIYRPLMADPKEQRRRRAGR
ncbi:RnfH family protein [Spectribacter hydrogenoxidans]|uniref:UPF0125 protein RM532_03495 n=1 Tax=Spectribacter hydrogenoxidans TaxID=3075608 RepID=A0ABU3BXH1_9GAMM|nr:RnfH family protein [Salinisphaera sp. W335]MDT0634017.1 RnfH family protein [Salinisphaera sp. W335]